MATLISAADLSYMRATINETLPDTCNILSESIPHDGQGGVTSTWGTASGTVICRLDDLVRASNTAEPVAGALRAAHQYQLSLPYGSTISAGNRVEIGGASYTVVSVNANQSWMAVTRAVIELI